MAPAGLVSYHGKSRVVAGIHVCSDSLGQTSNIISSTEFGYFHIAALYIYFQFSQL